MYMLDPKTASADEMRKSLRDAASKAQTLQWRDNAIEHLEAERIKVGLQLFVPSGMDFAFEKIEGVTTEQIAEELREPIRAMLQKKTEQLRDEIQKLISGGTEE